MFVSRNRCHGRRRDALDALSGLPGDLWAEGERGGTATPTDLSGC